MLTPVLAFPNIIDDENKSVASASRSTTLRLRKPDIRLQIIKTGLERKGFFVTDGVDGSSDGVMCCSLHLIHAICGLLVAISGA